MRSPDNGKPVTDSRLLYKVLYHHTNSLTPHGCDMQLPISNRSSRFPNWLYDHRKQNPSLKPGAQTTCQAMPSHQCCFQPSSQLPALHTPPHASPCTPYRLQIIYGPPAASETTPRGHRRDRHWKITGQFQLIRYTRSRSSTSIHVLICFHIIACGRVSSSLQWRNHQWRCYADV